MKISVKSRYALASLICLSRNYNDLKYVTLSSLADHLNISKIYLEQVFSLLKRANLVVSLKGASGGYILSRSPSEITIKDIFYAIELSLFESAYTANSAPTNAIEYAINEVVFMPLEETLKQSLVSVTLEMLQNRADILENNSESMYYI